MDEGYSDECPHLGHSPPCKKCQDMSCFILHDYSALECPLQVCDVCSTLAKIDEEISDAQALLINLAKRRQETKRRINSRHDRLISILPVEVMSNIFEYSVESYMDTEPVTPHCWKVVTLLGSVSKDWRAITLGTPQLWTTVTIDLSKDSSRLDLVKEWLRRSWSLPLNITFYYIPLDQDLDVDRQVIALAPILQVLRSQSSRWQNPVFEMPPFVFHAFLQGLDTVPEVNNLKISLFNGRPGIPLPEIFLQRPLLPRVFYSSCFSPAKMFFQWDNLTHLDVCVICIDELVHIIHHAPKLINCECDSPTQDKGIYPLPTTPIINDSLQCLDAIFLDDYSTNLLRYVAFPSLKKLTYTLRPVDRAEDILVAFLGHCETPPETFILTYQMIRQYTVEPWAHFSAVTHLVVQIFPSLREDRSPELSMSIAKSFLEALCDPGALVLPNLQYLTIFSAFPPSIWELLTEFLKCRMDPAEFFTADTNNHGTLSSDGGRPTGSQRMFTKPILEVEIQEFLMESDDDLHTYLSKGMTKETFMHFLEVQRSGVALTFKDYLQRDVLEMAARLYLGQDEAVDTVLTDTYGKSGEGVEVGDRDGLDGEEAGDN